MKIFSVLAATFLLLALPAAAATTNGACAPGSTTTIAQGTLCGMVSAKADDIFVYKGLPYARPPTPANNLRWMPPQPPQGWSGERHAVEFGAICPQYAADGITLQGDEDCLTLNVWTPKSALDGKTALPVMVFIHGGSFTSGAGSLASYDGAALASMGPIVVVTLNYRLGSLGFLFADKAAGGTLERPIPGNLGLMDQQAALSWVQANAAAFGGDPDKVTVFGESAGAMSVGLHHFAMPSSGPLFRASIMESNPMGVLYPLVAEASANGQDFIAALCGATVTPSNCLPSFANLQDYSLRQVFRATNVYELNRIQHEADVGFLQSMPWGPVVDGTLVTGQSLNGYTPQSRPNPKPFIFGMNGDEGVLFAGIACAAFASNHGEVNPNPAEAGQCLATGAKSSMMNTQWYDGAIAALYGVHGLARITAFSDSRGQTPYAVRSLKGTGFYNAAAQAMAAVSGDDTFICANLRSANRALAQAPRQPVYAYSFTQPPLFDLLAGSGSQACAPANGMVCHGDELAYVFNTLDVTTAEFNGVLPVPAANHQLAKAMGKAWTDFARDLSPPGAWRPYGQSGEALVWHGDGSAPTMTARLATNAHCRTLWDKVDSDSVKPASH